MQFWNQQIHRGQLVRSAGTVTLLLGHDEMYKFMLFNLSYGEVRKIKNEYRLTVEFISNPEHNIINLCKVGISGHL